MFKFGFADAETAAKIKDESKRKSTRKWLKSEEIFVGNNVVPEEFLSNDNEGLCTIEVSDGASIRHVSADEVTRLICRRKNDDGGVFQAEANHSDLITAVYEGGLKVWQCTYDLLEYLEVNKEPFDGRKVLDLGCGAGILGIYAFVNGAKVHFQDYNPEVIKYVTIPNVLLNLRDGRNAKDCRYFSGDWESYLDVTKEDFGGEEDRFDCIVSSETIYNCDNYDKLISVFESRLKKTGVVYMAAKTYYFGVGGGTREFEDALLSHGAFKSESCWTTTEGVQREILKVTFK